MEAMERQYLEGTISVFTEESCSAGHLTVCSAQKRSRSVSKGKKSNCQPVMFIKALFKSCTIW